MKTSNLFDCSLVPNTVVLLACVAGCGAAQVRIAPLTASEVTVQVPSTTEPEARWKVGATEAWSSGPSEPQAQRCRGNRCLLAPPMVWQLHLAGGREAYHCRAASFMVANQVGYKPAVLSDPVAFSCKHLKVMDFEQWAAKEGDSWFENSGEDVLRVALDRMTDSPRQGDLIAEGAAIRIDRAELPAGPVDVPHQFKLVALGQTVGWLTGGPEPQLHLAHNLAPVVARAAEHAALLLLSFDLRAARHFRGLPELPAQWARTGNPEAAAAGLASPQ